MILGVFIILLVCLYLVIKPGNTKATTDRAWDMIKIIAGFLLGL
jgi:hypothetical protein